MLHSVRAAAHTSFPTIPFRRHTVALLPKPHCRFPLRSHSSARMSSSAPNQIIEHFVLFKVKPDADPTAVDAMISNLNSLTSLPSVLHLSAGPVSRCRSTSLTFTHMLHSRYRSKSDLISYADHPSHVGVVADYVKPVVEDVMAVDWVAEELSGPEVVAPGSAVKLTAMKLKDGVGEEGKREVLGVLGGIGEKFGSFGENFSPGRAKGYSICSVTVFEGEKELDLEKDKISEIVDAVLELDYTVAAPVLPATI